MTIQIIVFIVIILLSMLLAKIYNPIHGLISFFGFGALILFVQFLDFKIDAFTLPTKLYDAFGIASTCISLPLVAIVQNFKLSFMSDIFKPTFYVVTLGIWVISFVVSQLFKSMKTKR